jgi:uncharacterized protein YndB with AHSA1/START domain
VSGPRDYTVRIERSFPARAGDVFDAWTSPEVMRRWFHCYSDWETPQAEVDLRVGGRIWVVMRRPDGRESWAEGEFKLIDRPHRLVMSWKFGEDPDDEQLIELSFSESAGTTTVVMLNTGIATDQRRGSQEVGWHGCLDQLERVMTG